MANEIIIKGKKFQKSSYSGPPSHNCVGVLIEKDKVVVTNTKNAKNLVEFKRSEWEAFIQGVKNSEFDLK